MTRRPRWIAFTAVALALGAAVAPRALAQSPASPSEHDVALARHHFEAGRAYYNEGRFEDAVREFDEAYRLTHHPDVLYNLGAAYERLGRLEDAVREYRAYLDAKPTASDRGAVEARIAELEERRQSATASPESVASEQPSRAPPPPAELGTTPPGTTDRRSIEGGSVMPVLGWIAIAVAGASAIAATVTGLSALSKYNELDTACGVMRTCAPGDADKIETGETLALATDVLFGVSIAAAATGIVLLLLADEDSAAEAGASRAHLGIGAGTLDLRIQF